MFSDAGKKKHGRTVTPSSPSATSSVFRGGVTYYHIINQWKNEPLPARIFHKRQNGRGCILLANDAFNKDFSESAFRIVENKNAKLSGWWRASKDLPSGPPLLLAACLWVACLRWTGRSPEGKLLDSVPERSTLSEGERKDDLFPAGSKPPDMDLTSPGWEWNWSLRSTVKLSSWLDGGSKELYGVIYTDVYSQLCSIICFTWSTPEAATNLGTSHFTPRSTALAPATPDLQCVLDISVVFTISRYWIPRVPQLCATASQSEAWELSDRWLLKNCF